MFEDIGKQLITVGVSNIHHLLVSQRRMRQHTSGIKPGVQHIGITIFTNMYIE
ncbi:hypothetical protein D3C81_2060590 [compost metagenome]